MRTIATGMFAIVLFVGPPAFALEKEPYCRWHDPIDENRIADSDALLLPLESHAATQLSEHLPNGMPSAVSVADPSELLLAQPDYIIWYDMDLRAPLWTAHHLTQAEAIAKPPRTNSGEAPKAEKRADSFRSDPRLNEIQKSTCKNYKEPIFDQGHMVPNADLDFLTPGETISRSMDHTFLMSNMTPQHCAFNRGPWQVLEGLVRDWASQHENTWIITGAIYDRDGNVGRDADENAWRMKGKSGQRLVAIPSHQYKIVAVKDGDAWKAISFMIPNNDLLVNKSDMPEYMKSHLVSLTSIAEASGITFMEGLEIQEAVEIWPTVGSWNRPLISGCKDSYPDQ